MGSMISTDEPLPGGVLIDVRSQDEWNSGHINGAIHIPVDRIEHKISQHVPNKSNPINLYCLSGSRASSAKSILVRLGYERVANLGGMNNARKLLQK